MTGNGRTARVFFLYLKNAIVYCHQSGVNSYVTTINVIDEFGKILRKLHAHLVLLVDSKLYTARVDK